MDLVNVSIYTHLFTIYFLLAVMVFNLFSVLNITNFIVLVKRLRLMTPFYHFLNASTAYTGMIVAGYNHDLSPTVIFMILSTILILILEIKRYKKMRIIKSTDIVRQEAFIIYAKKIYIIEISAIIFTYIVSKIF
jgi:hypothetical protein